MILPSSFDRFDNITCVDFEFQAPPGERVTPICAVAVEARTGKRKRVFFDAPYPQPFYPVGANDLVIAYFASAEMSCHLSVGWSCPVNVLDLFCEYRCQTNNGSRRCAASLLDALRAYGIDSIGCSEKEEMRQLAMRGGTYSEHEKSALLDYCETDVQALVKLLPVMSEHIDLDRALLRGRYMASVALMEYNGIPINRLTFEKLRDKWADIQEELIKRADRDFGVYDGRSFRQKKFSEYLKANDIPWPRYPTGKLDLRDDTFKSMASAYPAINPLRELRSTLSKMRLSELAVGSDDRNRCLLSPFASKTSRNQPSNSRFIYGPAVWLRSLIKPSEGKALAYIDWEQQEFGVGAALSQDEAMMDAYVSGDPYLTFAKQAGAVPADATKQSHSQDRERFKLVALGVQYGMGPHSLALKVGQPLAYGQELLDLHKKTYPRFWRWQDGTIAGARYRKFISTVYGWKMKVDRATSTRTIANFPIQGNGAEMLRIAINYALSEGIKVCAPVHDALLIESAIDQIEVDIAKTQMCMDKASRHVLAGFPLRSDVEVIFYPDHYSDNRGQATWDLVSEILDTFEHEHESPPSAPRCSSVHSIYSL